MGLVIDTSALVALERSDADWSNALPDEPAVVAAVVYAELLVGVQMADSRKRAASQRAKIDALLATVPLVDFELAQADVRRTSRTGASSAPRNASGSSTRSPPSRLSA